jgi:hypothetical protein
MNIVKVRYYSETTGAASGREYCYFTEEPLAVGDLVKVPVKDRIGKAVVTAVDVPEAEIAAFRDMVKVIVAGSVIKPQGAVLGRLVPDEKASAADLVPNQEELFQAFNCPSDCRFLVQGSGPYDNPQVGGCANENAAIPAGSTLEIDDATLPLCPGYEKREPDTAAVIEAVKAQVPPNLFDRLKVERQSDGSIDFTVKETAQEDIVATKDIGFGIIAKSDVLNLAVVKVKPDLDLAVQDLFREGLRLQEYAHARVIATNDDLKPAVNDLALIAKCRKAITEKRVEYIKPIRGHLDQVNKAFEEFLAPFDDAEKMTKAKVQAFQEDVARRTAEAKRIEDEKFRLAQEEAKLTGGEITVPLGTAPTPPPAPTIIRTESATVSGRDNWKARVLDFKALPDEYKLPNEQMLNAKARTTKGQAQVPGVEFFNDRSVTVRTK